MENVRCLSAYSVNLINVSTLRLIHELQDVKTASCALTQLHSMRFLGYYFLSLFNRAILKTFRPAEDSPQILLCLIFLSTMS